MPQIGPITGMKVLPSFQSSAAIEGGWYCDQDEIFSCHVFGRSGAVGAAGAAGAAAAMRGEKPSKAMEAFAACKQASAQSSCHSSPDNFASVREMPWRAQDHRMLWCADTAGGCWSARGPAGAA